MTNKPYKKNKRCKKVPDGKIDEVNCNLKEKTQIIVQFGTGKDTDAEWDELIRREKEKIIPTDSVPANC